MPLAVGRLAMVPGSRARAYRQSMNFTMEGLVEARAAIKRVNEARGRLARIAGGQEPAGTDELAEMLGRCEQEFVASICDDLNTSEALAAVFGLVSEVNKAQPSAAGAEGALALFDRFERVLGCFGPMEKVGEKGEDVAVRELLDQREAAREARDFATADRKRKELHALGYKIVDTPQGPRLERN